MDKPITTIVYIYVSDNDINLFDIEKITNTCGEFMEVLGFELETEDEPIFGSYWKKIKFIFAKHVSPEELDDVFYKGKKALQLQYVDLPTADQTEKLASSAGKLLLAIDKFEEAVIRLGALLVIKKMVNGKAKIIIQQLNTELIKILDEKPHLLQSPKTIYELVTGDIGKKILTDDAESEAVIE